VRRIGAAKFKECCLALLDDLEPEGVIITKRGKPVARLVPVEREGADLLGCLRHKIQIRGDLESTGVTWDVAEP
jgi:antitoxin (DNA-binding transcriptional repressor) of toxin-antitoxin stability system